MNHKDTEAQRIENGAARNPLGNAGRDPLTEGIIGCAIEVHRELGPGLLESIYEHCLAIELARAEIPFERQVRLPVNYKGIVLGVDYRLDLVVANEFIVELKCVDRLLPIHEAQLPTYLRLAEIKTGLLMNFHGPYIRTGIKRMVV